MSINIITNGAQNSLTLRCADLIVDGNASISGLIGPGDVLVENDHPSVSIFNNTTNSNGALLQLQGSSTVTGPANVFQGGDGNMIIQNFATNKNITTISTGTSSSIVLQSGGHINVSSQDIATDIVRPLYVSTLGVVSSGPPTAVLSNVLTLEGQQLE